MADAVEGEDGLEPTVWRFVRSLYLRLLSFGTLHPKSMSPEQEATMLDAHTAAMEHDTQLIMELIRRGTVEASEAWRARLHEAEGVDHEMLDEAIGFALAGKNE